MCRRSGRTVSCATHRPRWKPIWPQGCPVVSTVLQLKLNFLKSMNISLFRKLIIEKAGTLTGVGCVLSLCQHPITSGWRGHAEGPGCPAQLMTRLTTAKPSPAGRISYLQLAEGGAGGRTGCRPPVINESLSAPIMCQQ